MQKMEIELYTTPSNKSPFSNWMGTLNTLTRAIIRKRLTRLELGNFGDAKSIKGTKGLFELRIHEGPGYRVYYGKKGNVIIVLLTAGKKSTQSRDIAKAKEYWSDYLENN
ncbi:MAG: type II toxin-antitoxin system RelE/ParE family toxin [Simkaniaceae bacterium]|nr:MAG: type II toxin-antitoxin system RelE/ParE family toxin [Simkaniaceae bacterium]